mmetsp:Transcript_43537/g.53439  ORF Transcript_43537/g.53439 Transcript_43537/m.53439 type:complete len:249 (-) Transcript_43537:1270-2016(-)
MNRKYDLIQINYNKNSNLDQLFKSNTCCQINFEWNTNIIWIPNWLSKNAGHQLKNIFLKYIKFEQPYLKFNVKDPKTGKINVKTVKQPRKSAWISDIFNQTIQDRNDSEILKRIPFDIWTKCLTKYAMNTCLTTFNSMLILHYVDGNHSVGMHSDDDDGLVNNPTIGSLSLGETRTFKIITKKKSKILNKKIEINIPLKHGCFVVMNKNFQKHWLHGIPKEKHITKDRINVTFRHYVCDRDRDTSSLV